MLNKKFQNKLGPAWLTLYTQRFYFILFILNVCAAGKKKIPFAFLTTGWKDFGVSLWWFQKKIPITQWVKRSRWFESHMLWPAQYTKGHIQLLLYKINTQEMKSSTYYVQHFISSKTGEGVFNRYHIRIHKKKKRKKKQALLFSCD